MRLRIFFAAAFLFFLALIFIARAEQPLAPATIVVYNEANPESFELARFYAQKRGIARDHVIGLTCSNDEEISREDFDRTIAGPLRQIFRDRKWWILQKNAEGQDAVAGSSIHFVALIRGVPLKVKSAENYPGDKKGAAPIGDRNEASVDSEIAVLARFGPQISGGAINPYFKSYRTVMEAPESAAVLLVCRLDAPSVATVKQMITDAIATEKNGLWGRAFVDGAHNTGGGLEMGDTWLADVVESLHVAGIPSVYEDTPALFPAGYPVSDCALYYGWYAGNVTGPFADPAFRFSTGAIAVHIHSFSASSLRDPNGSWVAPLLTRGAAASVGNVYEPYLQLTTHLDILNDRLLHGFTFAESSYMGTQVLSWMTVMVGDPLYRPYAAWLQIDASADSTRKSNEWKMYHEFAVRNAAKPAPEFRQLAREAASRAHNAPMIEDLGLMEMREGNFAAATNYFQQARSIYSKRDDILRVVLEESDAWKKLEKPDRALQLVRGVLKIVSDAPTTALLKKIEQELSSAPNHPAAK